MEHLDENHEMDYHGMEETSTITDESTYFPMTGPTYIPITGPSNLTVPSDTEEKTGPSYIEEITGRPENVCSFSVTDLHSEPVVFDSGSPYGHGQYCSNEFSCEDSSVALHFKFNRFSLEQGYDYLSIGSGDFILNDFIYDNLMFYEDYNGHYEGHSRQNFLVLTGEQETGVWVNAESIQNVQNFGSNSKLRVTFLRRGFEEHFSCCKQIKIIKLNLLMIF